MTVNLEKEEKLKEERWQDCLRIMQNVVSSGILEFNIMQAGKLKSGSALVRRLIELIGTTQIALNDDAFMIRVVKLIEREQQRLALEKEQNLAQAEFFRLRRLRLLGIITPDEERHPDGPKKKKLKSTNLANEVEKVRSMEKKMKAENEELDKLLNSLPSKSAEDIKGAIPKSSSLEVNEDSDQYEYRDRSREHPYLKDFDECKTAEGLYDIAEKIMSTPTTHERESHKEPVEDKESIHEAPITE